MDTLERFNAALTYIEVNLDNDIDSRELSKITLYSAYQFQKLFTAMSGIPLSEYIRNRRLDRAAFDLRNTDAYTIPNLYQRSNRYEVSYRRAKGFSISRL